MPIALVVADGSWVTNEVRAALSIGSWQIEEIDDPRLVVDRIEESRVDAVIIDMQVGSAGGMAVVRWIRQATDPALRPRMVLLLDRSADVFLAGRAGADASVLKPFDAAVLRSALALEPAQAVSGEGGRVARRSPPPASEASVGGSVAEGNGGGPGALAGEEE